MTASRSISGILYRRPLRIIGDDHPSMRSTRRLPCGERTTHAFCSILLRVPCHRPTSPPAVVRSYRTVSPLPDRNRSCAIGGVFSVARDVRFPRPGSRQHSVLRSPDFPQPRTKCATAVTRLTRRQNSGYGRPVPGEALATTRRRPRCQSATL